MLCPRIRNILLYSISFFSISCASSIERQVQDIYYYPGGFLSNEYFENSQRKPYTLTQCFKPCVTTYILRKNYDRYAREYTDLGLEYPYPKKIGTKDILMPKLNK